MAVRLIRGELVRPFATEPRGNVSAVTGTVRLMSARDVRAFFESEYPDLKKKHGVVLAEAHLFARCLKSWDVMDGDESTAPITPENVAALPEAAFEQLYGVVTGTAAEGTLKN